MPRLDAGNELADMLKGSAYAPEVYEYDKTAEEATPEKPAACATKVSPETVQAACGEVLADGSCANTMAPLVPRDVHTDGRTDVIEPMLPVTMVAKYVTAGLPGEYVDAAVAHPMSSSEPTVTPEAAAPPIVYVTDMPLVNDTPPVMGMAATTHDCTAAGKVMDAAVPVGDEHAPAPAAAHANTGVPKVVMDAEYAGPVDA